MWGMPDFFRHGLIPAHAGKTVSGSPWGGGRGAHPRSRGENHDTVPEESQLVGSSPLTRGKQRIVDYDGEPHGLIPAHAGKTERQQPAQANPEAHPRSRGENVSRT